MSWVFAATLDSIPRRGARVLRIGTISVALFRTQDDAVFALRDRCPHKGGPLSQGIVHGHCVTCPLHDWIIDLATGAARGPDEGATATFPVRVEEGRVHVAVPAASEDSQRASAPLAAAR